MDIELEEMRQQMNILKEKLQKQNIVNDKIFRRSMRRSVMGISRKYMVVSVLCILMIPYSYWAFVSLAGMSFYFWLATCALMLLCFGYTLYNGRDLNSRLVDRDLVDARSRVARAKKLDSDWLKIGIPLAILWIGYFAYEQYRINEGGDWKYMMAAAGIGTAVGLAIGLKVHFKIQSDYEQIIDEIDDFTQES